MTRLAKTILKRKRWKTHTPYFKIFCEAITMNNTV